jgi:hypothetical protein
MSVYAYAVFEEKANEKKETKQKKKERWRMEATLAHFLIFLWSFIFPGNEKQKGRKGRQRDTHKNCAGAKKGMEALEEQEGIVVVVAAVAHFSPDT